MTDDDLRDRIARWLAGDGGAIPTWDGLSDAAKAAYLREADEWIAGPLAPLLADLDRLTAERDAARAGLAALARVRTLADTWQGRAGHWNTWTPPGPAAHYGATLRKAIDGTP